MDIVIVLDVTKYFFTYSPAHWGWHQWVARPPQVRWPTRLHLLGFAPGQCAVAVCSNICIIGVCTQELWFQIKGRLQFGLLSVFNRKIVFGGQEWNSFLFRYKCIFVVWSFVCQRSGLHRLWYATIRDTSTWSKFGAHGEHGDVFMFSNLVRCALILREPCSFADV